MSPPLPDWQFGKGQPLNRGRVAKQLVERDRHVEYAHRLGVVDRVYQSCACGEDAELGDAVRTEPAKNQFRSFKSFEAARETGRSFSVTAGRSTILPDHPFTVPAKGLQIAILVIGRTGPETR